MDADFLKHSVLQAFPEACFQEDGQLFTILATPGNSYAIIAQLKTNPALTFDTLSCLTATDFQSHLMMVYILFSRKNNFSVQLKIKLEDREYPEVDSITSLWKGAELLEREVYDMFGIKFSNHPDLRRLFSPDEWEGYPLRKDYEDEVNMIKL